MIPRVSSLEDAKDLSSQQRIQPRVSTLKVLKTLMLFLVLGVGFSLFSLYMTRHFTVQNMVMQVRTTCFDEQTTLERWIRPPSSLMHSMSDQELFWRASFVPLVNKYPYQRVPKIAFMFLTRGPLPLAPLWECFFKGNEGFYSIYIHALPNYVANFSLSSVFYHRQIPSQARMIGIFSFKCYPHEEVSLVALHSALTHILSPSGNISRWSPMALLWGTFAAMDRPSSSSSEMLAVEGPRPLVRSARGNGFGRRGMLTSVLLSTAAAAADSSDSKTALLQEYIKRSKENKVRNDKERLDDYYKRNYKDYFELVEGSAQGKKEEQLSESEKEIREWLRKNKK